MYVPKLIRAETKAIGDSRIHAILSTEAEDRDGDIVHQAGWDLSHFERHPVLVASHDYRDLRSQIGEWHEVKVKGSGKSAHLEGVAEYYVGRGNEQADWGYDLAQRGKAAYSVGFVPLEEPTEREGGGYEFTRQELLEISHVLVPSNRGALQLMRKMADLHPVLKELVESELDEDADDRAIDQAELLDQVIERVRLILPDEVAMLLKRPIAAHGTATSEGAWDGPANEARLRTGAEASYYRRAYAWNDPEGEANTKSAYKFIHHEVAGDGGISAANLRGCSAGIAVLNGGRGGANIPDSDRSGVWAHLARHLRDGDREPPELRDFAAETARLRQLLRIGG